MRDFPMPSDAELMRELERAELRRLEPQSTTTTIRRRAQTSKPVR